MADVKDQISSLTALGAAPATNDLLVMVDVSDAFSQTGATKKMTVANLFTSPAMTGTATAVALTAGTFTLTGAAGINGALLALDGTGVTRRIALVFGTTVQVGALDAGWATDTTVGYQNNLFFYNFGLTQNVGSFNSAGVLTASLGLVVSAGGVTATGTSSITGTLAVSSTINSQTISAAASFTGTLTVATSLTVSGGGITHHSGTLLTTTVALTAGGTGFTPALTQGPVGGNPTKWVPINDNGTTRYCPLW